MKDLLHKVFWGCLAIAIFGFVSDMMATYIGVSRLGIGSEGDIAMRNLMASIGVPGSLAFIFFFILISLIISYVIIDNSFDSNTGRLFDGVFIALCFLLLFGGIMHIFIGTFSWIGVI